MKARAHVFVSGRVQGIGFRSSASRKARGLGIKGFVRNLAGGGVEMICEGDKEKIEQIIEWARGGPLFAKVSHIDVEWKKYKGEFEEFETRY